ncbi:MAG: cytochrome b N-terminal domain-containing protein [Chloroflexi bacterium]|nr:cytochrome b N-terminal domain-containing protein [Chloroflexota bacterium]
MVERVIDWLDERAGIRAVWSAIFERRVPRGIGWLYNLGAAALFLFVLQTVTGIFLAMYYSPSPDHAYESIQYISNEVVFGSFIRGLHHWGASAMVVVVTLHMLTVFALGSYKYPRETTWVVGVFLLLITLGFGFTGYLLPWDEKAYWATNVGTNMAGTVPILGDFLLKVVRGGTDLGAVTLTRFYAVHVLVLPAVALALVGAHLYLVIRQGVSAPPGAWDEEQVSGQAEEPAAHQGVSR